MEQFSSGKKPKAKFGPRRQLKNSQFALKPAKVRKVIYACDSPRDRPLVATLAATGMRRAEAAALDVRDIDLEARRLTIRSGKGAKQRTVPITEELASNLRLLIGKRAIGPIFLSNRRGPLTTRHVNYIVADAGVRAGVKNPNPASRGRLTCHSSDTPSQDIGSSAAATSRALHRFSDTRAAQRPWISTARFRSMTFRPTTTA